jgi:hypothetical protein
MRFATLLAIVLAGVLTVHLSTSSAAPVAPGSTVAGKTIGEWTADWWNWTASVNGNVFKDTTGALQTQNQSGPVWFVAGSTSGVPPVTRTFDVPPGKFVLFPLINWIVANGPDPGFSNTAEEATALVDGTVDPAQLFAEVDGAAISDLAGRRERAPENFTFTVTNDTFPAGTYTDANADGYWVMLEPLSAGPHTLHFGGTSKDFTGPDPALTVPSFTIDVTDDLTVPAAPPTPLPLPAGALAAVPAMAVAARVWLKRHAA